jgi:hypothetical protein
VNLDEATLLALIQEELRQQARESSGLIIAYVREGDEAYMGLDGDFNIKQLASVIYTAVMAEAAAVRYPRQG